MRNRFFYAVLRAVFTASFAAAAIQIPASFAQAQQAFSLEGQTATYSGTFDPPTQAHLGIIRSILTRKVKKLYLWVNASSPTKDFKASTQERIEMLRAALPEFEGKIEIMGVMQNEKDQVLHQIEAANKGKVYQFIGQDSFNVLPTAFKTDPTREWVVIPRSSGMATSPVASAPNVHVESLDLPKGASSTLLREQLAIGNPNLELLDQRVGNYISSRGLYRSLPAELLPVQEAIYRNAFAAFLKDVHTSNPKFAFEGLAEPKFDAYQSREAWTEKFMNWVVTRKNLSGDDAKAFRESATKVLYANNKGRLYSKLPFLEGARTLTTQVSGVSSKPVITPIKVETNNLLTEPHTLDLEEYLGQRFPKGLQDFINNGHVPVYMHQGETGSALNMHTADGFTESYTVQISRGNPMARNTVLRNPKTGEYRFVVPNLPTEDRLAQVQGQIELFAKNVPVYQVAQGQRPEVFAFNAVGEKLHLNADDQVVIGFKNAVFAKYGTDPQFKTAVISSSGIDIVMYTDVKTGKRIINPRNVYGDEMKEVLQKFYDKGARKFFMLGTSGGLDPKFKIGDVLVPTSITVRPGETVKFSNQGSALLKGTSGLTVHEDVRHGWVQTILQESKGNAQKLQQSGIQSVDIEGRYLGEFLANKKDVTGGMVLFVSDQPLGNLNYVANNGTLPTVQDSVSRSLEPFFKPARAPTSPTNTSGCIKVLGQVGAHL